MKLGVNIDHIATVRQARRTFEPEPVSAAVLAELAGADGIVVHLREDRRHIQDRDLSLLKEVVTTKLNLEMGLSEEIIRIALSVKPHQVTLVPERRQELTTEGGLDLTKERKRVEEAIKLFKKNKIVVSLFIDPNREQLQIAKLVGADMVELHTGEYANVVDPEDRRICLHKLAESAVTARNMRLQVSAGHGLTYNNVQPITKIMEIEELNIGHSIIARSVLVGIERAVREMKEILLRK
ncbi:MAG: pyridoxine 5'-phosphate synthase [Planctomycetota bacterium]|nr:pyridoxine 5'-phosphate synthase [Planctomycetota bacterium]MDI6788169.1 pyridoxine 5'-phosphate synthase [Planctomycetota bacterium]